MKITKRQLKRIIREEKSKLMNESIAGSMPLIGIGALGSSPMSSRPLRHQSKKSNPSVNENQLLPDNWTKMFFDAKGFTAADVDGEFEPALYDGLEIIGLGKEMTGYYDLKLSNGESLYAISSYHIGFK